MKRFLTSIAILLSFVWTLSAQTLLFQTNTDIQQKGDYNYLQEDGYPMGCMATAMTIVMDYHKSPTTYDYTTVTGEKGLAQLMLDAAHSINTQFGATESSAALSEVALQLVNRFGYDVSTLKYRLKAQSGLSDKDWVSLIVRDINNGMPVIYSAGTVPEVTVYKEDTDNIPQVSIRHAFIIDGIRPNTAAPYGYDFHINAGQGSGIDAEENSKWVSDIFNVTINGLTYSDTPEMITGIRTPKEAEAGTSSLKIMSYDGSRGLSMSVSSIKTNEAFNVYVSSLQNWDDAGNEFVGYIFPVLVRTENGQQITTTPSNTAQIARQYKKGSGFIYRQILKTLSFEGVVFGTAEDANKNLKDYTLRLATADNVNGTGYKLKLIETLAGENSDVIGAVPAVSSDKVTLTFTKENGGGLNFYYRDLSNGKLEFPEITGTIEVPYGQPFLFFAKKATTAGGNGTVILNVENKYLMKDYFASQNFTNFDGAFYITPTADMTINGQIILEANKQQKTIDLTTAGILAQYISDNKINPCNLGNLKITGVINAEDIYYIRDNMPMLEELDLSEADIMPVGVHPANTIPESAFYKEVYAKDGYALSLKNVILPENCVMIGSNAFMYCSKLEEINLPKNIKQINYNAFFGCKNLKDVYIYNPVPYYINWCVFKNISNYSTLHVVKGTKNLFVGEENKNKIPGTVYSINEWYNRWHDGSSQGTCVEMDETATEGQIKVQLMRTNYIAFQSSGQQPGTREWNGGDFIIKPSILTPVSYAMWKLRAAVSYTKAGADQTEYVYGTSSKADYTFNLNSKLTELQNAGIASASVKIDVYLDVTEAVEERIKEGQNYFYPYIYDGMEVTLINGWTNSKGSTLDLDDFYFGLRSGFATNLVKAKAIITLDNARIGSIQTGLVDFDLVLKGENEMAGLYYSKFESFLIDNGHIVSIKGNGTLTLANDTYNEDEGVFGPRAYSTSGGVLNLQHGITVKNLENMTFENIKITYTRTFERTVKDESGKKGIGWETLSLPFDVYRVEKENGRQLSWVTPSKSGDFWLREMVDNAPDLTFSSDIKQIEAGKSYIISVPDEGSYNLVGQPITFVGPTLVNAEKLVDEKDFKYSTYNKGDIHVEMTPYPYSKDMGNETYFIMNRTGNSFYRWTTDTQEDENHVALRQFEAYFMPVNAASANINAFSLVGDVIGGETTGVTETENAGTGMTVQGGNGVIIVVSDHAQTVNVVAVDGRAYMHNLKTGMNRINVSAGVYIIGGKKVLVK